MHRRLHYQGRPDAADSQARRPAGRAATHQPCLRADRVGRSTGRPRTGLGGPGATDPSTSSTSKTSGSRLRSPGCASDAPFPAPVATVPSASRAEARNRRFPRRAPPRRPHGALAALAALRPPVLALTPTPVAARFAYSDRRSLHRTPPQRTQSFSGKLTTSRSLDDTA